MWEADRVVVRRLPGEIQGGRQSDKRHDVLVMWVLQGISQRLHQRIVHLPALLQKRRRNIKGSNLCPSQGRFLRDKTGPTGNIKNNCTLDNVCSIQQSFHALCCEISPLTLVLSGNGIICNRGVGLHI